MTQINYHKMNRISINPQLEIIRLMLLLIFVSASILTVSAQDTQLQKYLEKKEGGIHPNILKINTLAVPFSNISLSYERRLAQRLSLNLSAGYKYGGFLPGYLSIDSDIIKTNVEAISGYSFTPGLRYYVKTCDPTLLEGLYVGIYTRYTFNSTNASFDYYPEGLEEEFYNCELKMTEMGAGISIGYQLLLWKRLSLDFLFFGPRFSNYYLSYNFDQQVSQAFLDDLSDAINETINQFGIDYNVELNQSGETQASNTFSFVNMRFGISIGFAF